MKWVCLAVLIIDLVLIGAASFRFLTVPRSEVEKYQANIMFEEIGDEAGASSGGDDFMNSTESTPDATSATDDYVGEGFDNKDISLDDESIWEYDDQETKQTGLQEAMKEKNAIFGGGDN